MVGLRGELSPAVPAAGNAPDTAQDSRREAPSKGWTSCHAEDLRAARPRERPQGLPQLPGRPTLSLEVWLDVPGAWTRAPTHSRRGVRAEGPLAGPHQGLEPKRPVLASSVGPKARRAA